MHGIFVMIMHHSKILVGSLNGPVGPQPRGQKVSEAPRIFVLVVAQKVHSRGSN